MRIDFADKSYIQIVRSNSSDDKIVITVAAKSMKNPLELINNSVEISVEQLDLFLKELNLKT